MEKVTSCSDTLDPLGFRKELLQAALIVPTEPMLQGVESILCTRAQNYLDAAAAYTEDGHGVTQLECLCLYC